MNQTRVEDVWPLSPLQEGLLFHALYDEKVADVYTAQRILDLEGGLDVAVLRASWEAMLARHAQPARRLPAACRSPAAGAGDHASGEASLA